ASLLEDAITRINFSKVDFSKMYLSKLESEMLFGLLIHSGIGRVSPGGWNAFSGYCVFACLRVCRSAGKGCAGA
ncbi:hypothetical protein, partial [Adlercreutzia shanghongiae]